MTNELMINGQSQLVKSGAILGQFNGLYFQATNGDKDLSNIEILTFIQAQMTLRAHSIIADQNAHFSLESDGLIMWRQQPIATVKRLYDNIGIIKKTDVFSTVKSLSWEDRSQLKRHHVNFGFYCLYIPACIKPFAARLRMILLSVFNHGVPPLHESDFPLNKAHVLPTDATLLVGKHLPLYQGYYHFKKLAVRIDILERLKKMVIGEIKKNSDRRFQISEAMLSIAGLGSAGFVELMSEMGYVPHNFLGMAESPRDIESLYASSQLYFVKSPQHLHSKLKAEPKNDGQRKRIVKKPKSRSIERQPTARQRSEKAEHFYSEKPVSQKALTMKLLGEHNPFNKFLPK